MENAAALPALHTIAYPEKYKPHLHEGGASFFAGKTDHPISATMCSMITTIWNVTTRCIILVLSLYWYILR